MSFSLFSCRQTCEFCFCFTIKVNFAKAIPTGYGLQVSHTVNLLHCPASSRSWTFDSFCKEEVSPKARMHLSMDNMGIVDDSCLDNYDMAKATGSNIGGRVHSIDVILGFAKDQDPLLHSAGDDDNQKSNNIENPPHPEKQAPSDTYGHLPELGDSAQKSSYHGESFQKRNTMCPNPCLYYHYLHPLKQDLSFVYSS